MNEGLFRCKICGEVYFGKHPSHCPHCGAHEKYMLKMDAWQDENMPIEGISDITKKNLEETRGLEYDATRFYRAAAKETKSDVVKGFFKYLARTEKEHYEVASKLLGQPIEDSINEPSEGLGSDLLNVKKSQEMEEHVTPLYAKFASEAVEPRAKEVFAAISEVEADHIELDKEEIGKLS
ncbi:MAG: ferritin family protein [Patescibacteria group bacterium]|nr:ferritin family protein [Patescibacteria group bacterium]